MCCDSSNCWACDELSEVKEIVTRGIEVLHERDLYLDVLRDVQRHLRYDKKKSRLDARLVKRIDEAIGGK